MAIESAGLGSVARFKGFSRRTRIMLGVSAVAIIGGLAGGYLGSQEDNGKEQAPKIEQPKDTI